ncbi:MAG: 4-hydroxyacetophenone monooxygenase [Sphingopyxis sp.]|nr:MAG: 4-hydroxyacetophenone monooxygenase [Sphingopyxis sp.]
MEKFDILVVGGGFGGLGMGHQLKQAGLDDFVILEKADQVGGTWRENSYPGAECDVPSALYSYSFAPNPDWKHKWSKQPQIFAYLKHCARKFGLYPHIRFGQAVTAAEYDDGRGRWTVSTENGDKFDCQHFICALGQLHHPSIPAFAGRDEFSGPQFHSAKWAHDIDLKDKRVAVIGNAASALQFIPHVAAVADTLTVYQRSANWVLPKGDRPYTALEKWISRKIPFLAKLYRLGIWAKQELIVYPIIAGSKWHQRVARSAFRRNLKSAISDPELRKMLTPNYTIGAKRILVSDTLFPALARENVDLVTEGIKQFTATSIITKDGVTRAHDIVIYGTGFRTNPFLQSIEVTGHGGKRLRNVWTGGARAFLGIAVPGFPNLHMLYGPNTNTGHTSIIYKLEAQIRYIIQLIQLSGSGAIEVRKDVAEQFDKEMQARLSQTAWDRVAASWYKDGDRITNNWPGSSWEYYRRTRRVDPSHYMAADIYNTNA